MRGKPLIHASRPCSPEACKRVFVCGAVLPPPAVPLLAKPIEQVVAPDTAGDSAAADLMPIAS